MIRKLRFFFFTVSVVCDKISLDDLKITTGSFLLLSVFNEFNNESAALSPGALFVVEADFFFEIVSAFCAIRLRLIIRKLGKIKYFFMLFYLDKLFFV